MKITIDTDDFNREGTDQVFRVIKEIQTRYPNATVEEIFWGMAHCTASGAVDDYDNDVFMTCYLPSLADSNKWTPNVWLRGGR